MHMQSVSDKLLSELIVHEVEGLTHYGALLFSYIFQYFLQYEFSLVPSIDKLRLEIRSDSSVGCMR